jgi:hypothetical protein
MHDFDNLPATELGGLRTAKCAICGAPAQRAAPWLAAQRKDEARSEPGLLCNSCWLKKAVEVVAQATAQFAAHERPTILGAALRQSIRALRPRRRRLEHADQAQQPILLPGPSGEG